jgi:sulfur relay protein TusB/DsrH
MVLYEDGVYWAVPTGADSIVREAARQHNVYVVNADLTARGLSESALLAGLSGIDYREFVRLVTRHTHCQSWF